MKKWMKYIFVFLCVFMIGGLFTEKTCLAASAEVTVSTDVAQVTVGDKFFVYVYINSETDFGNFEANLKYDDQVLQYLSGAPVITGDSGYLRISDMNVLDGDTTRKYTMEFQALQVGISDISFDGRAVVYEFGTDNEMSVSSSGLTMNVTAPANASTDANLKTLKIKPSELTPSFSPDIKEYSTTVGSDVDQLFITALPDDSKATVSISGNELLKEGENKVIVSVLAESGNVIEYTINVTREAAQSVTVTPTAAPEVTQNSFEIVQIDGANYAIINGRYTILEPDDSVEIPEGYYKDTQILAGVSVTAFLPEKNPASEFILLYVQNEFGETGFYQYDRVEKTLQRYAPDGLINGQSGDTTDNENGLTDKYNANLTKAAVVIALLGAFSVLMSIVIIRLLLKSRGKKGRDSE